MWVKDGSWAQWGDGFVLLQRLTHRTRAKRIISGERGIRSGVFYGGREDSGTRKRGGIISNP